MTTFYLIRHGSNDFAGKTLVGRTPGIHLNDTGRAEVERLADELARESIQHLFSSPMERCRETAAPIAKKLNLEVQILDGLIEVEFGDWTGQNIAEMNSDERWRKWNTFRSGGRIPNGESIWEVQTRMIAAIEKLRRDFPNQTLALFSHGDPLRAAITYYLGMPIDFIHRLELSPASVSVLMIDDWTAKIQALNLRFSETRLQP
ncbi:MAG TPA: histidine phosphatase family protein [Verrucomicrobiae bacterium]|nr:histidine phosphatase family protein [Verrucomicrobiae bacterium]